MITAAIASAARSSTNVKPLLRLLLRNNRHTARISVDAHLMLRLFTRKLEHGPLNCSIGMEAGNCESSRPQLAYSEHLDYYVGLNDNVSVF